MNDWASQGTALEDEKLDALTEQLDELSRVLLRRLDKRLGSVSPPRAHSSLELPHERLRLADLTLKTRLPRLPEYLKELADSRGRRTSLTYAGLVQEAINGWLEDRAAALDAWPGGDSLHPPRSGVAGSGDPLEHYVGGLGGRVSVPLGALRCITVDLRNLVAHDVLADDAIGPYDTAIAQTLIVYLLLGALQVASQRRVRPPPFDGFVLDMASVKSGLDSLFDATLSGASRALLGGADGSTPKELCRAVQTWATPRELPNATPRQCIEILCGYPIPGTRPIPSALSVSNYYRAVLQGELSWVFSFVPYARAWDLLRPADAPELKGGLLDLRHGRDGEDANSRRDAKTHAASFPLRDELGSALGVLLHAYAVDRLDNPGRSAEKKQRGRRRDTRAGS